MNLPLSRYVFLMTRAAAGAELASSGNCVLHQGKTTDKSGGLHAVRRQAGGGRGLVQRLGQEDVNSLAVCRVLR